MNRIVLPPLVILFAAAAYANDHTPLEFTVAGNQIIASGEIDGDTLDAFEEITSEHPDIDTLVLQYIGGSVDDEANVEFGRIVRELEFTTHVPSDGLVASGGTDLFLAGVNRILEPGACVGVHSWAAEDFTATDLPRKDPEHDRYLEYYEDIGIDEDFYWFTIQAAPADGMHWVSADEADLYEMSTSPTHSLGSSTACNGR